MLFMVVYCSQLAAWPSWVGGSDSLKVLKLQEKVYQKDEEINSLKASIEELQIRLNQQVSLPDSSMISSEEYDQKVQKLAQDLMSSNTSLKEKERQIEIYKSELASYENQVNEIVSLAQDSENMDIAVQEIVKNLKDKVLSLNQQLDDAHDLISKLNSELEITKTLSGISQDDWDTQFAQYNELRTAYDDKVQEADEYYKKLLTADKGFGGMIGGGTSYDPADNSFDLQLEAGLEYNKVMITAGVSYPMEDVLVFNINPADFVYSAGFQIRF